MSKRSLRHEMHSLYLDEHDAFRETCHAFVDRTLVPRQQEFAQQHSLGRDVWMEAGRYGLLGLEVPEKFGGGGANDYRFNAVLAEELSRASAAASSMITIHADVVAPYLVDLGTLEQKERWLPRFCTGELITAIAMTEPGGGSDLASLKTVAQRENDQWVLNGSKTFITNGSTADLVIVAARTSNGGGARGISLFAVESGTPGFEPGKPLSKIGQHEADTAELHLRDVRLTDDCLLGEVDHGFIYMMERLPQERLSAAVANLAHAKWIFDETLDYSKERTAFGKPIGSFQHNAFRMAEMRTKIEVSQAYVDRCVADHCSGELSGVDAAMAKWWTAEVQGEVLDWCVQMYGGYGFMQEYRVGRAWADARVTRIWAGSNEIMKLIISRDMGL